MHSNVLFLPIVHRDGTIDNNGDYHGRLHSGTNVQHATMETRLRRYEISGPKFMIDAEAASCPTPPARAPDIVSDGGGGSFPWVGPNRPLSDIHELSEPSIMDNPPSKFTAPPQHHQTASKSSSIRRQRSARRTGSTKSIRLVQGSLHARAKSLENGSSSYSTTPEPLSMYNVPHSSIPRRSSSQTHAHRPGDAYEEHACPQPASPPCQKPPAAPEVFIQKRTLRPSPVKEGGIPLDPVISEKERQLPLQTSVRHPHPSEVLNSPCYKHPRVKVELQVSAPLFVGGGNVEGHVRLTVDGNDRLRHRRSISVGTVSVDLLGFEDVSGNRKATFLALGTELIDTSHPPPPIMVEAVHPVFASEEFWPLASGSMLLPFKIRLPLDTGPPPFQTKHASIRFLLAATTVVRDAGKLYHVRTSQEVHIVPTYDPEKALSSLQTPLTARDEMTLGRVTENQSVQVTASLHRQVWVSGSSIFVNVHISNNSRKPVKRLELTLERDVLLYKHAAATTMEKSASQARIFQSNEQTVLVKSSFKPGAMGWDSVDPYTSDSRTCEIELPRGHGTVRCGKYFEVRYFLNVTAMVSKTTRVSVQLPIIVIHINSLDVVPNSIDQVAAAIEEKCASIQRRRSRSQHSHNTHGRQRSFSSSHNTELRRRPSYVQGRAFAAPRQQSLERQREHDIDMDDLCLTLDASPRKHTRATAAAPSVPRSAIRNPPSNLSLHSLTRGGQGSDGPTVLGAMSYDTPPELRLQVLPPPPLPPPPPPLSHTRHDAPSLRRRLRGMHSLETFRTRAAAGKDAAREPKKSPTSVAIGTHPPQSSPHRIQPRTLGLTEIYSGTGWKASFDAPASERAGTALGLRDKLERGRFEFKAIGKKASGGLKDKSRNWWDPRRNHVDEEKGREGWI